VNRLVDLREWLFSLSTTHCLKSRKWNEMSKLYVVEQNSSLLRSGKLNSFTDSFVQVFAADSWFLLFSTPKGMPACGIPCRHSRNLSLLAGLSTSRPPCRVRIAVRTRRGRHPGPRYFFYSTATLKRLIQEPDFQPPCLFRSVTYSEIKPQL
jgi:hypothetical protein